MYLQERIRSAIARAVIDSEADIGILNAGNDGKELTVLPYRRDELALVVPQGHTLLRNSAMRLIMSAGDAPSEPSA